MSKLSVYRLSSAGENIFLYPTPVDKKRKPLVIPKSSWQGEVIREGLNFGVIPSPLGLEDIYNSLGLHSDQQTPKFELLDGAIASPKTGLVTVEPHDIDDQTVTPGHRAFVDCDTIVALEAMAHKTYAPATAASREAGAGAGLTDND